MGPTTWRWLSVVTFIFLTMTSSLIEAERAPDFVCPKKDKCSCYKDSSTEFIIECKPNSIYSDDPFLLVNIIIKPVFTVVTLTCTSQVKPQNFSMLPKMDNLNVYQLEIRSCPLPPTSFYDLMSSLSLDASSLRTLQITTRRYRSPLEATKISVLNKSHMKGLNKLNRIIINGAIDLEEDLFEDNKDLEWLSLKSNQIRLHQNFLKPISQLQILELSQLDMQSLPSGLFKHLAKLERLNMWQCKISNLSADSFEGLETLVELDLSMNLLETLPSDLFINVPKLKVLNLSANKFTSLPENLFSNTPDLEKLRLNGNNDAVLQLPEKFLSNLTMLTEIQMKQCNIEHMPKSLMWESPVIKSISFEGNFLKEISDNLFKDQANLEELNLQKNEISYIHDEAFQSLTNLKVLNLDYNIVSNITRYTFASLISLEKLYMYKNNLQAISTDAFVNTNKLVKIDMSYNNLTLINPIYINAEFDEYVRISPFDTIHELKHLNLSHNQITEIFSGWRLSTNHLNSLDLSFNNIMRIEFNDIHFLSRDIIVDLQFNNITEIDFRSAELVVDSQPQQDERKSLIRINGNPIHCDCSLLDFVLYLQKKLDPRVRKFIEVDPGNDMCASPRPFKEVALKNVQPQQLYCPLDHPQSQEKPLCPKNCSCNIRGYDKSLIIDCAASYPSLPLSLPNIENKSLNFIEFNMSYNMIPDLSNLISNKEALHQIKKLYLNNNNISHISIDDIPNKIEVLNLQNNRISYMNSTTADMLKNLTHLKKLMISGNPIRCDCDNQYFISFLKSFYQKVGDYGNITCSDGKKIATLPEADLCGATPAVIALSVTIALVGLILGVLVAIYYKYQLEIKVWLYARGLCLWWITEKELDKDKIYDAFISFSHKDEDFVVNKLVAELEGGPRPFKICVHFRDWRPGEYISDQILKSVQDSRRTLVILSPNFIDSVWGRMEFKTAHTSALTEGRARVIIILYGDIGSTENLDPELKAYLSMNTYLKWGDPLFWEKLRYALPHPPYTKQLRPTHVLSKKGFDDRLELIHPTTPGTPPGQNTPPAHQAHTNPLMNHVNSIPNGIKSSNMYNGTITMNGLKVNGNAKHSDV